MLTPIAALPVKPTRWPTIDVIDDALQSADDVREHRRPREFPDRVRSGPSMIERSYLRRSGRAWAARRASRPTVQAGRRASREWESARPSRGRRSFDEYEVLRGDWPWRKGNRPHDLRVFVLYL